MTTSDTAKLSQLPITEPVNGVTPINDQAMMESYLPIFDDERKSAFLSYRATGFSLTEAYKLTGINMSQLVEWQRTDPTFVHEYDLILSASSRQRALRYIEYEFVRNFKLMLLKDSQVVAKSLDSPGEMTKSDLDYLKSARNHYTPSSLQSLRGLLGGQQGSGPISFTQFVLSLSQGTQQPQPESRLTMKTAIIEGEKS